MDTLRKKYTWTNQKGSRLMEKTKCCVNLRNQSIYGLKQASRQWNIKFNDTITSFGFEENAVDRCIYRKVSESKFIFLVLYVDDILLVANVLGILRHMKDFLLNNFEMDEFLRNLMLMNVQLELFPFKRETNSVSRIAHRMFWKESKWSQFHMLLL
jgi:Reverse transcriptase (RNA-dependent DNA polymerase)